MMYTLDRLFIFLAPLFLIAGCNQNNEVTNQANTDQSTENTENTENTKASVEESTTQPLQGTVNGESFQLDEASFQSGVDTLTLKQGENLELAVKLFLFREDASKPLVGEHLKVNCQENSTPAQTVHLYMIWKPNNAESIKQKATTCGYNLDLKFGGKQGDDVLPATLNLQSEKFGINLSGSFEVEIKGFRLVNGEPDLGQDSLKVFQVLAVRQLEERLGYPVALVDVSNAWWKTENQNTEVQEGYGIFWWKKTTEAKRPDPWDNRFASKDKESDGFTKLRFVKEDDEWVVDSKLQPWQLPDAHPLPSKSSLHLSKMLDQKAASIAEQAHLKANGKTPLFQAEVSTSYNPVSGVAVTKVITIEDPMKARDLSLGFFNGKGGKKVRYLFRRQGARSRDPNPEAWQLVQELTDEQTVDMKTGEVKNKAKTTK